MDYINQPQSLIYKKRDSLNDFGVQIPGTINNYLFTQMRKLTLLRCGNAREIALQCFNNAYYICTLTQLDEFPDLIQDGYEKKLMEVEIPFSGDVYQASMALVCLLLAAYDDKYKQKDDLLIESIHYWTSSNRWTGSLCHNSFVDIINTCNTDSFILPKSEFAPRDIIDAIENVGVNDLAIGVKYVCNKLDLLDDQRIRMYGADLAIAHLRDDLREIYEDWGYDPKTKKFDPEMEEPVGDYIQDLQFFNKATKFKEEAVEYLLDHYPTEKINTNEQAVNIPQKPETDEQNTKIIELESNLSTQSRQLMKAHEIIEEFRQPVEELTAEQKVRMAFALKLLKAAGLKDDKLDKNKSKVATIMSLLTGISSKKSGTQVCQNYLIDQKYYPRKENMDTLIRLNTLCSDLGINVCLGLESQGNK